MVVIGLGIGAAILASSMTYLEMGEKVVEALVRHPDYTGITVQLRQADISQLLRPDGPPVVPLTAAEGGAPLRLTIEQVRELRSSIAGLAGILLGSMPRTFSDTLRAVDGRPVEDVSGRLLVLPIGVDYFAAYGLPFVAGHGFTWGDLAETRPVVILDESWARQTVPWIPPSDLVGHSILGFGKTWTVVGVVRRPPSDGPGGTSPFLPGGLAGWVPWGSVVGPEAEELDGLRFVPSADTDPGKVRRSLESELGGRFDLDLLSFSGPQDPSLGAGTPVVTAVAAMASLALLVASMTALNLALARARRRRRSVAIAAALGASVPGLFVESMLDASLLGLAGGLLGTAGAVGVLRVSERYLERALPLLSLPAGLGVTAGTLVWALGAGLAASLVMGLYPAYEAARGATAEELRGGVEPTVARG